MTPAWCAQGVQCVCEDDNWTDVFETGTVGRYPAHGERFTIARVLNVGGKAFLVLEESHVSPDLYAGSAFRPLTPLEKDVAMFDYAFKDAAAAAAREPVPAS